MACRGKRIRYSPLHFGACISVGSALQYLGGPEAIVLFSNEEQVVVDNSSRVTDPVVSVGGVKAGSASNSRGAGSRLTPPQSRAQDSLAQYGGHCIEGSHEC
jgi:hypothetical protein